MTDPAPNSVEVFFDAEADQFCLVRPFDGGATVPFVFSVEEADWIARALEKHLEDRLKGRAPPPAVALPPELPTENVNADVAQAFNESRNPPASQ